MKEPLSTGATELPPMIVGIATTGRAETLTRVIRHMDALEPPPQRIMLSVIRPLDLEGVATERVPLEVIVTERPGASGQRNDILERAPEGSVIVFFDDDFVPAESYLGAVGTLMATRPDVVMVTGTVLADGILGPGLAIEDADAILREDRADAQSASEIDPIPVHNGYGCNMAVRRDAAAGAGIRFDERLPLYSWLEDVDFSRRLALHGSILRSAEARGVHLGVKSGRTPGLRLGYSQVINPLYLWRKGTFAGWRALRQVGRNIAANAWRSARPEPWVDRLGRLRGNLLGLAHALTGRLDPEHAAKL
ncbi:MAG: glycosyltransferase family 2 protein [Pseudomonadota bacterium]